MWDQIRRSRLHPDYPPFVDLWLREARRSFIAVEGDATDYGIMLALTMRRLYPHANIKCRSVDITFDPYDTKRRP